MARNPRLQRNRPGSFTFSEAGVIKGGMSQPTAATSKNDLSETLRGCRLFAGIPPADLIAIQEITVKKLVTKGAYLFREGEPSKGFYVVQSGAINVHRVNVAGKEQVIHIFRAGESFAEGSLATENGYPADARSVEDSPVF